MSSLALLGLGTMGHVMAERMLDAGHDVAVWNRTAARAAPLGERGARVAIHPADAVRDADVVILMLADARASEAILFGADGAASALRAGTLVIDCGTIGPDAARRSAERVRAAGARYVDAPVLGSTPAVRQGALTALAGGDAHDVDDAERALAPVARRVVRAGAVGSGNALKLVMNLLVGGLTELLAEGTLLAERSGVAAGVVKETLDASVLRSAFLDYKAPQVLGRDFTPLFGAALMRKDFDLILAQAHAVGAPVPAATVVRDAYARCEALGFGDRDFAAVITALERGAGVTE